MNILLMLLSRALVRLPFLGGALGVAFALIGGGWRGAIAHMADMFAPTNIINWWVAGVTIALGLLLANWLGKRVIAGAGGESREYRWRHFVRPQFGWAVWYFYIMMPLGLAAGIVYQWMIGGFAQVWAVYSGDIISLENVLNYVMFIGSLVPAIAYYAWREKVEERYRDVANN